MKLKTYHDEIYIQYYSMLDTEIMRRNTRKLEREVLKAGS